MFKRSFSMLLLLVFTFSITLGEPLAREDIDARHKWKLDDIYSGWDAWEQDLKTLEQRMDEYAALEGTLTDGPEALLKAYRLSDELGILGDKVYTYPSMIRDLDNRDNDVYARLQQVQILWSKFGTATSWFGPELLSIPEKTMQEWLDATPDLAPYRFGIENSYRLQAHVLDAEKEKLLSYFSPIYGLPNTIHTQLSTADIEFETITLSNGEEALVTEGGYAAIIASNRNQDDRRAAMEARNGVYAANVNTYAAAYNGICQRDWAYAQARNYASCLESELEGNNIPVAVYTNLLEAVRQGTEPLRRYHDLRRRALNLDHYHFYDSSLPVVEIDLNYEYDDVAELVMQSMKPMGREYSRNLKQAFTPGWVDVYEVPGKSTGAYSGGVYGVHPYMLLNYNNTLDDVFTLAHEMGHTVHTMFSWESQPYNLSSYTLFVAEVASTMAEAHLLDHMLENTSDPRERLVLLSHAINSIAGTFYTQVLFADFEYQAHKLAEEGQPMTADVLNGIYHQLMVDYYGDSVTLDPLYDITWARIPHFFFAPYYVYQYATSFAASAALYEDTRDGSRRERRAAVDRYIGLLQSGGSDFPVAQLRQAGVDMTQDAPVNAVMARMDELVNQFEADLKKLDLID